jgi:CO/xanthine dehydrogenase Mo-binding subunit
MLSPPDSEYHDVMYGSYGLDQCLDLVERALETDALRPQLSPDWLIGEGIALTMIDTVPPAGHLADCRIALRDDGGFELTVGTAEFGNGTATVHRQIAASALATTVDRIILRQSDTAHGGHDTSAYGSAGIFVAGRATQAAAKKPRRRDQGAVSELTQVDPDACTIENEAWSAASTACPLPSLQKPRNQRKHAGRQRQRRGFAQIGCLQRAGFRVAVNKATGEVKILKSVRRPMPAASPIPCVPRTGRRRRRASRLAQRCTKKW